MSPRPAPARVDQVLPTFGYGDAIGNDVLALRGLLRARGVRSDIFALSAHERVRREARPFAEYRSVDAPGNVCLFHFSIGTPIADAFRQLRSRRVLVYHNITPAEFARGVSRRLERECRTGREQLRALAGATELAIADSAFNRAELDEMGFARTAELPILVDFAAHDAPSPPGFEERWRDGRTNVLHVGRLAPNKRIDDLVRSFHLYRRANPASRLLLVGTDAGLENYGAAVRDLVRRLGTPDVHFCGHVDAGELCGFYRVADLYLVLSEHEGFCVPLLEAMHFGVPVVAYAAAAVPGTLGGAGVLVREKRFEEIAEVMHLVVTDGALRAGLVAAGRERLAAFAPAAVGERLVRILGGAGFLPG